MAKGCVLKRVNMISPKEKAKELVKQFKKYSNAYKWIEDIAGRNIVIVDSDEMHRNAKQCAFIAIDELIEYAQEWDDEDYYIEVREEIEKL